MKGKDIVSISTYKIEILQLVEKFSLLLDTILCIFLMTQLERVDF